MAVSGDGPTLEFPCEWGYRVIGTSEEEMRAAIAAAVDTAHHELRRGHTSSAGRYVSLHLRVRVENDAQRLAIHAALSRAACVRLVL